MTKSEVSLKSFAITSLVIEKVEVFVYLIIDSDADNVLIISTLQQGVQLIQRWLPTEIRVRGHKERMETAENSYGCVKFLLI